MSRSSRRSSTGGSSSRRPTSSSCSSLTSRYLRAAHEHDPALAEDAWRANVILSSPSTLIALLRTVAATWQQETVAESAREVHALGRELYERIGKVGDHLAKARPQPQRHRHRVQRGGRIARDARCSSTARKLEEHGIGGELELPAPVDRTARPAHRSRAGRGGRRSRSSRRDADAA